MLKKVLCSLFFASLACALADFSVGAYEIKSNGPVGAAMACNGSDAWNDPCSALAGSTCTSTYTYVTSGQPYKDILAEWGWRCTASGCVNIRVPVGSGEACTPHGGSS